MKLGAVIAVASLLFCVCPGYSQTAPSYEALIREGKTQLQTGQADRALATGEQAIKLDAQGWEGYALTGVALLKLRRYDEAINRLTDAIERAPQDKQTRLAALRKECFAAEWAATAPQPAPAAVRAPRESRTVQTPPPTPAATQPHEPVTATVQSPPSVSEILDWISQHLVAFDKLPSTAVKGQIGKPHVTRSLIGQGCTVFLETDTQTVYSKASRKFADTGNTANVDVLNLAMATPAGITVTPNAQQGIVQLSIPFAQPFLVLEDSDLSDQEDPSYTTIEQANIEVIDFTTQEMANRQAKAWRDAIIGCKAQAAPAAPDNLY